MNPFEFAAKFGGTQVGGGSDLGDLETRLNEVLKEWRKFELFYRLDPLEVLARVKTGEITPEDLK